MLCSQKINRVAITLTICCIRHIIMKGDLMIIEVNFYVRPDGTEPVREFLDSLTPKIRAKMFREIDLLVQNGQELRMPHSRPIGDGIFEIRERGSSAVIETAALLPPCS